MDYFSKLSEVSNMKKAVAIVTICTLVLCGFIACGPSSKSTDADVRSAISGLKDFYTELFSMFEKNKATPGQGITAAEKLVADNDKKLLGYGTVLHRPLSPEQMVMLDTFNNNVSAMSITISETLRKHYHKLDNAENRIHLLLNKVRLHHDVQIDREKIRQHREAAARKDEDCKKKGNCK